MNSDGCFTWSSFLVDLLLPTSIPLLTSSPSTLPCLSSDSICYPSDLSASIHSQNKTGWWEWPLRLISSFCCISMFQLLYVSFYSPYAECHWPVCQKFVPFSIATVSVCSMECAMLFVSRFKTSNRQKAVAECHPWHPRLTLMPSLVRWGDD